jgi:hypothetical protein
MQKNILCRVVRNRRTIMQQMPINPTAVTRLRHGEHIADTGVEIFLQNIFYEDSLRVIPGRAHSALTRVFDALWARARNPEHRGFLPFWIPGSPLRGAPE